MITIEQWRASIGTFRPNLSKFSTVSLNEYTCTSYVLSWEIVLVLMTLICNVNISFLIVMKLLIDGDVESNPGPTYNVTKIVKASFQGDPMFGVSAGMQCTCNSLFSICWSKIMKVCYWKPCDLDYVLKKGDQLFKNVGLYRYLSPDELPRELQIGSCIVRVSYLQNSTVEIKTSKSDFLRPSFVQFSDKSNGVIFFVNQLTFSIVWCASSFYIFDSHSRDDVGKLSQEGVSILMRFSSLRQVQNYISENYLAGRESILCQVQYILIELSSSDNLTFANLKKRTSRKRKYRCIISPETDLFSVGNEKDNCQQKTAEQNEPCTLFLMKCQK